MKLKIGKEKPKKQQPLPMIGGDGRSSKSTSNTETPTESTNEDQPKTKDTTKKSGKKKYLAAVALVAVFIMVAVLSFTYFKNEQSPNDEIVNEETAINESLVQEGYDAALNSIVKAAEDTNDPDEKARLYGEASLLASNSGNTEDAIKYGELITSGKPQPADYAAAAYAYEQAGDYNKAAEYFGLAANASPDKESTGDTEYNFYKSKQQENQEKTQ